MWSGTRHIGNMSFRPDTRGCWVSVSFSISFCVLPYNMLFMYALWAMIHIQIEATATVWRVNSSHALSSASERSQSANLLYNFPAWSLQGRSVVHIHSCAVGKTSAIKLKTPNFHLLQWSWLLSNSKRLKACVCVNVWKWNKTLHSSCFLTSYVSPELL